MEAEDVEELVVRGTVVDIVDEDDDEEEEEHDLHGGGGRRARRRRGRALKCALDGAVAVDLVVLRTWQRR